MKRKEISPVWKILKGTFLDSDSGIPEAKFVWAGVLLKRPAGRWERGSGWGAHVNPWLIRVSVWQNPLQYCKVISLQLIKINGKKKLKKEKKKDLQGD